MQKHIISHAGCCKKAVLIGGGLLGLEITVVEFFPRLLPRQLDGEGGHRLQNILEDRGFSFRLDAKTSTIEGNDEVESVTLENGEVIAADMVFIFAGVNPKLDLAMQLGLDCNRGIKVDKQMRTSHPDSMQPEILWSLQGGHTVSGLLPWNRGKLQEQIFQPH
jgi:nitrite reductase (NADH) large subunit